MFCWKCGNADSFRTNHTARTVACRNPKCNNLLRTSKNFDFRGVDEVQWFAQQMLQKLNTPRNQVKPAWDSTRLSQLLLLLKAEVRELENELARQATGATDADAILSECCDVANFAMMIADNAYITKKLCD